MPIAGVAFYFATSTRYIDTKVVWAKLFSLSILTIILPLLLYLLLKTIGKVSSIHLSSAKERIIPLMLNALVIILVLQTVLQPQYYIELYYFFVGILISTLACLILVLFNFKVSIHMIAICGVFMFFIALSIHFSININNTLALMAIAIGAVATSRLHLKAHTTIELIMGSVIGLFPQLILVTNWL
jgi:hypothetical protein